jgi:hypothetical protein
MGELLVGEAIVIATEDAATPWLISAPTMRVPMRVRSSINAYLATKAILLAVRSHHSDIPIQTIAIPGLGTGIGQLAPEVAASQMFQAYREVIHNEAKYPGSFAEAQRMHVNLNRTAMLTTSISRFSSKSRQMNRCLTTRCRQRHAGVAVGVSTHRPRPRAWLSLGSLGDSSRTLNDHRNHSCRDSRRRRAHGSRSRDVRVSSTGAAHLS